MLTIHPNKSQPVINRTSPPRHPLYRNMPRTNPHPAASSPAVSRHHSTPYDLQSRDVPRTTSSVPATENPKRPWNSFFCYRSEMRKTMDTDPQWMAKKIPENEKSKLIGVMWNEASEDVKEHYRRIAKGRAAEHKKQYPDYSYHPISRTKDDKKARSSKEQGKLASSATPSMDSKTYQYPTASYEARGPYVTTYVDPSGHHYDYYAPAPHGSSSNATSWQPTPQGSGMSMGSNSYPYSQSSSSAPPSQSRSAVHSAHQRNDYYDTSDPWGFQSSQSYASGVPYSMGERPPSNGCMDPRRL